MKALWQCFCIVLLLFNIDQKKIKLECLFGFLWKALSSLQRKMINRNEVKYATLNCHEQKPVEM